MAFPSRKQIPKFPDWPILAGCLAGCLGIYCGLCDRAWSQSSDRINTPPQPLSPLLPGKSPDSDFIPPFSPKTSPSLKPPSTPALPPASEDIPDRIVVERFIFEGNTAFGQQELAAVTAPFTGRPITFDELLQARSAVTQLYVDRGYVTSGAFIPPQTLESGAVKIKIVEGSLEAINVRVEGKLDPAYVRNRLALGAGTPLNLNHLLEALQLLQLDPLISKISAELGASPQPGRNILDVTVVPAPSFEVRVLSDNGRSPSVGSFRRGGELAENNLSGGGDRLAVQYLNTDGSDDFTLSYQRPVNSYNGRIKFEARRVTAQVISPEELAPLDINSAYQQYRATFQQPVLQNPNQSLVLGLTFDYQTSGTSYLDHLPFPGRGTNLDGQVTASALRFFQEWTQRSERDVLAARSEFSLGLDVLGSTVAYDAPFNPDAPSTRYFLWRGQGQWVKLLAPNTLFLLRGDVQVANRPVVFLEQYGLGGLGSVRGYRQNTLLTDSGLFASMEFRLPILRIGEIEGVLQLAPFLDFGVGWNIPGNSDPDPNVLASTGIGLLWQSGEAVSIRLDWGIPLGRVPFRGNSWQDDGITFSIQIQP